MNETALYNYWENYCSVLNQGRVSRLRQRWDAFLRFQDIWPLYIQGACNVNLLLSSINEAYDNVYRQQYLIGGKKQRDFGILGLLLRYEIAPKRLPSRETPPFLQMLKNVPDEKLAVTVTRFCKLLKEVCSLEKKESDASYINQWSVSPLIWLLNGERYGYVTAKKKLRLAAMALDCPDIVEAANAPQQRNGGLLVAQEFMQRIGESLQRRELLHTPAEFAGGGGSRTEKLVLSDFLEFIGSKECEKYNRECSNRRTENENSHESRPQAGAMNLIVFGSPGVGKSHFVSELLSKEKKYVRRVVFYEDYTNAEFIGQLMPCADAAHPYAFAPGPLACSLRDALADPMHHYFLVIEEINRGPAAAIFGEVFQLLDRDECGKSQFAGTNAEVSGWLLLQMPENVSLRTKEILSSGQIFLPANLSLIATMNTADQNVTPLDHAFLRRWRMYLKKKEWNEAVTHRNSVIDDTGVTWEAFCKVINKLIVSKNAGMLSTEDKQLGPFFMKPEDFDGSGADKDKPECLKTLLPVLHAELFAAKVLRYLWDDAFRLSRTEVFTVRTYEDLLTQYCSAMREDRFNVFEQSIRNDLLSTNHESE